MGRRGEECNSDRGREGGREGRREGESEEGREGGGEPRLQYRTALIEGALAPAHAPDGRTSESQPSDKEFPYFRHFKLVHCCTIIIDTA